MNVLSECTNKDKSINTNINKHRQIQANTQGGNP